MTYTARPPHCSIGGCLKPAWARAMCRMHYARWHTHGDPNITLVKQSPAGAPMAFLNAIALDGEGCVVWPFSRNNMGYGLVRPDGRTVVASRFSCERRNGPAPDPRHQAAHTCGKGHLGCVAPWHLVWKTPRENNHDQNEHRTRSRGDHHAFKLSSKQVEQIKGLKQTISQQEIATLFGVSQSMVSRIFHGKAWKGPAA